MKYKQLLARRAALVQSMRDMSNKADQEGRQFSDEETAKYEGFKTELAQVRSAVAREEELIAMEKEAIGAAAAKGGDGGSLVDPNQSQADQKKWGSLGEFLGAVARAGMTGQMDSRLVAPAASTGMQEAVGSDGGFLVNTDFAATLLRRAYDNSQIIPRCSRVPLSANSNGININALAETSRADGSRWGGIQAYWLEEGGSYTGSRPKFRQISLKLKKLIGLCYATDELMADAVALESIISQGFGEEFAFKLQDGVINGTGAGQLLGVLNSPALVTVSKESGPQTADTIVAANVQKMYARLWARGINTAVWLINQNCWQQIFALADAAGNSLFFPPGDPAGISRTPYGTLLGRPIIPVEQCSSIGDVGDILFCDFSQYLFCDKGTMESASSMHVAFLTGEMAFRFTYRCDGQPSWNAALTPFKGSLTQSPFIALEAR